MKAKVFITFTILISISIITSFNIPKKVIDQIQMVTVLGYDKVDDDQIRGTVIVPNYVSKTKVENIVYSDLGDMMFETQTKLNLVASEELYNGKLEIAMYGAELAESGIRSYTDYLTREPSIGSHTYLAIAKENANKIMKNLQTDQSAGLYLSDLIEHNMVNGNIPETNLKIFQTSLISKLRDPYLPIITIRDKKAELTGIGLFDDDKLVYQLPYENAFVFKGLVEELGNGKHVLKKDNKKIAIQSIDSTKKFKVKGSAENPIIHINVRFNGVIREYTGTNLDKQIKELTQYWEKETESKGMELINKFKELQIDPLGVGLQVKAKNRNFELSRWEDLYPNVEIKLNVDCKLIETGTRN